LTYCVPLGIPHSTFLSWDTADQDKALAWIIVEKTRCGSCGTHTDEWIDEDGYHKEPEPFHAVGYRCHGCQALDEEREKLPERESGWHVHFQRGPRPVEPLED
jgi:hypothetical protein